MKIGQIIREKRKDLSLTQEQVADYLGVSAPAVSKWEKGSAYPDITLLPALARLLKTDLNTLMSFNEDLSDMEIRNFVDSLSALTESEGYEAAYQAGLDKIREYPRCEKLIYSVISYLEGAMYLYGIKDDEEVYRNTFEKYYGQLAESHEPQIRDFALQMLISRSRNRGDFARAEELIRSLPTSSINVDEQLAILCFRQEKYEESQKLWERQVLNSVTEIQTALMYMMETALKENGEEKDAGYFADVYEQVSRLFHVAEWIPLNARLQLSVIRKDSRECIKILKEMLPLMNRRWKPQDSPLYRHLSGEDSGFLSDRLLVLFKEEMITEDGDFAFLRSSEEYAELEQTLKHL